MPGGWRSAVVVAGVVAMAVVGVGCTSDGGPTTSAASTTAPEDRRATAAEVADGLAKLRSSARAAAKAAADDPDAAIEAVDGVQATWLLIEGTIKQNDADAYLDFEDAIAGLRIGVEKGDPTSASHAVDDLASLADAYLDQFHR